MTGTYVVAEIGSNHGGSLQAITRAVEDAARAGVSAVKLQWVSDAKSMARRRGQDPNGGYAETLDRYLAWPADWHAAIAYGCEKHDVDYICTVFIPRDVLVISPHVARFKVASFEAMDEQMLAAHAGYERPVLVSTGMLGENEVQLLLLRDWDIKLQLLHCVSAYPAPLEALNLALLRSGKYAGFSDHSDPSLTMTGALAVAAGARIVEAHVRVEGQDPGLPDYAHAMDTAQFVEYVDNIRDAERAAGSEGTRRMQECEAGMAEYRVRT